MSEIKNIPVVFSCDENYAVPLCVSLLSMLKKAKKTTFYEVYILLEQDFSAKSKEKILSLRKKYANCNITFLVIGNEFDHAFVSLHITKAAYFRLKIASLLPDIPKCLYLDCDILVLKDLTELFETDLEECVLAGVHDPGIGKKDKLQRGLKKESVYVNSGVLLLDLDKIRKENLEMKFISLAKKQYQCHDQDIINIACEGKIKLLELKYNFSANSIYQESGVFKNTRQLETNFTEEEIQYALKNKVILHYLGNYKPWKIRNLFYEEVWWMYQDEVVKLSAV